ncbi:MAG: hypothetical protein AAGD25_32945 [Cyanobacteria bacterium P01_F01_bin.150]
MGRDQALQDLYSLWQQVDGSISLPMVGIVGMAGVGKSELAIQYGRSHPNTYPGGVAWFSAETFGQDLRNWLQIEFSPDRDLRHLDRLEQQVALGWKEWRDFCGGRSALVIIDDVTDYQRQVAPYLPQNLPQNLSDGLSQDLHQNPEQPLPFRIILTSRKRLASLFTMPTLDVGELAPEDAVTMLERLAGEARINRDRPTALNLCQRLAYLPLAIALVPLG